MDNVKKYFKPVIIGAVIGIGIMGCVELINRNIQHTYDLDKGMKATYVVKYGAIPQVIEIENKKGIKIIDKDRNGEFDTTVSKDGLTTINGDPILRYMDYMSSSNSEKKEIITDGMLMAFGKSLLEKNVQTKLKQEKGLTRLLF